MRTAFIGCGNMGGALARGLYKAGALKADEITCSARTDATLSKMSMDIPGCKVTTSNCEAVQDADIVILAVKPWLAEQVICEIKDKLDYGKQIFVSVAAGVTTEKLNAMLEKNGGKVPALFYMIPNTAVEVLSSMTFFVPSNASEEQISLIEDMFGKVGSTMQVTEKQMPSCIAISSCGIAYAFRYIRAAMEGGIEMGLYAKDAKDIVSYTVLGAAKTILEKGTHPEAEIDRVSTPGGMTIKGLNAMEEAGFTNAVIKGLKAVK